jgi:hypothetical protein
VISGLFLEIVTCLFEEGKSDNLICFEIAKEFMIISTAIKKNFQ